MTQLEHELGTAIEALLKTINAADPRVQVGKIFNGHQYELAHMALREFLITRNKEGFVSECAERDHKWCADAVQMNEMCVACGVHRDVPNPFHLHEQLRNRPVAAGR